jgi:hypothetical protein
MVVIAGDEHDLAPGQRRAELFEEGAGALQRRAQRQLAQLQRVAAISAKSRRRISPSRSRSSPKAPPRCRSETIAVRKPPTYFLP